MFAACLLEKCSRQVMLDSCGERLLGLAFPQWDLEECGRLFHDAHQQLVNVVLQFMDVLFLLAQLLLSLQQELDEFIVGQVIILG